MRGFYSSVLYKRLPIALQNTFVTVKGFAYTSLRRGRRFAFLQKQLTDNEKLSADELAALQLSKLQRILRHASENVPFYQKQFRELGFDSKQLKAVDELKQLPILEKETIRKYLSEFIASNANRRFLFKGSTSGSTGTPLSLYMDRKLIQSEHAFVWRQYRWAGCPPHGRIACFRGDMVVPIQQDKPPYWRHDASSREGWFSSHHLSKDTAGCYLKGLQEFNPHLIYAYPSSITLLARYADEQGTRLVIPSLRGIVTSSETLYEHDRIVLSRVFDVPVYDWYGTFERVIFIGTCEFGSYHVFPEYGLTEFISVEGQEEQNIYELVGTGFINRIMPLIRYRTGDLVSLVSGRCQCGRNFPLVGSITGRLDDMIKTPEGRIVGRLDHIFKNAQHILISQIIQDKLDRIIIAIVPEPGFSEQDEKNIIKSALERLGTSIRVEVHIKDTIPRQSNGKFKAVISLVCNQKGE